MTDEPCDCGRPTAGAKLCPECGKTFRYALVHVGDYFNELVTVATKRSRFSAGPAVKGSIGKAQPLPVDTRFISGPPAAPSRPGASIAPGTQLRWDTWNTVVAWTRTVIVDNPAVPGPACGDPCLHTTCARIRRGQDRPGNTVASMISYLARHFSHLTRATWAPQILSEFLDLERRLVRMIDRPSDRWYAGRCGFSDEHGECTAELYAQEDRGTIVCPGCGILHDVAERRDFLLAEAAAYVVTASEAARALLAWTDYEGSETKLVDRIRKWRDREQLDVADVTSLHGRDRHLYRLGDIQALLVEHAQDEQTRTLGA